MACRISELVLGCRDPELLARFWCEVLDFVVLDREDDGSLEIGPREGFGGPQPTIILSRRDEPEPGKSRLHIDVNATDRDQDAELERLLRLGARPADIGQTGEATWMPLLHIRRCRGRGQAVSRLAANNYKPLCIRDSPPPHAAR
ncbi:VOC family protein [Streptomyces specialis]|uniref:VOC family protein n=1 Tax=Streptomyces specialis TaxID=498367 RepID=UPI000B0B0E2D|nr:VOC family protein [Streptomyces specialis]